MNSGKIPADLSGVAETLLIPLWARAVESRRSDAIVRDTLADALVARIDYDFGKFAGDRTMLAAIAIRTEILDEAARAFLAVHPSATVINLAAGLDTRFTRLDTGTLTWWEVDLPESMALRSRLLPAGPRHHHVAGSVLDPHWIAAIGPTADAPILVII